jgi:preprotein translocase subunit SecE
MASETKTKEDQAMAADTVTAAAEGPDADEPRGSRTPEPQRPTPARPGFFAIYKKGQGYWTRVGTAVGAGLLGALIVWQLYRYIPAFMSANDGGRAKRVALIVAAVFAAVYAFFAWRLMNKPSNVDFLIATDSEMKKVNWTSRRELIGSTKVVIGFMFAIAITLFLLDLFFNTVFYYLHILHDPWWKTLMGTGGGGQ